MCLGIPMRILSIDGLTALCEARGVTRQVNLALLSADLPAPDAFVLVHVGYAIQLLDPEDARATWELFDQILEQSPLEE